tara:strand:- start:1148 stop:1543 length:396 start_codon:yes stop_codon:yes gene_type:complete
MDNLKKGINKMKNQKEEIRQDILDKLDNNYIDTYACDLHHELCNTDYFIIGTYKAKQFLGADTFEIIEMIKEYEQNNFGEVSTDFSDAEKVANMFAYIVGEEILNESNHLNEVWNDELNEKDIKTIRKELK